MDRRGGGKWMRIAACVAAAGAAWAPAWGQADADAGAGKDGAPVVSAPLTEAQVADQALSVQLARQAMRCVRNVPEPQPGDFLLAAMLLEEASRLNPTDDDLLRRLTEAYTAAGDEEKALDATRRIVRLDPTDTVAQLRLISGQIRRLQSVDERIAAFERFLGPKGDAIDASVRSRLALDAALLWREQGDVDKFAEYLGKASALDPTNKDAASLAVAFFAESVDDAQGRLELLINLLKADPVDPATHLAIGRELAAAGAFRGADRFYKMWTGLMQVMQIEKDAKVAPEEWLIDWRLRGADQMVSRIWTLVEDRRSALRGKREYEKSLGMAEDQLTNPEGETFTIPISRTITIAASAIDDTERTRWALGELRRAVERERRERTERDPSDTGPSPDVEGELLWTRLWCGQDVDLAAADLEKWRSMPGINPVALKRVDGWLAVRRGEFEKAIELLSSLPADDVFGPLGLALVDELKGSKQSAIDGYTKIARERPGTLPGAWAATRCERLSGQAMAPSATAVALDSMIDAIPRWLEEMTQDPSRFMSMHAEVMPTGRTVLDRLRMRVRLRNLLPIPLGVGPDGPINSRMLVTSPLEVSGQRIPAKDFVVVGMADRRLRLLPQESFDAVISLDTGRLGDALMQLVGYSVRARFRVIQGFEAVSIGGQSTYQQGPLSSASETEPFSRAMALISRMEAVRVEGAIRAGGPVAAAEAAAALGWRLVEKPQEAAELTDEQVAGLAKALAEKYPLVGRTQRGLWIFTTPAGKELPVFEPVDTVMRAETDPVLAVLVALTRAKGPDDDLISTLETRKDAWLDLAMPRVRDYLKRRVAAAPKASPEQPATEPGTIGGTSAAPGGPVPNGAPAPTPSPSPTPAPAAGKPAGSPAPGR